jgi:hypothetical protein
MEYSQNMREQVIARLIAKAGVDSSILSLGTISSTDVSGFPE